MSQRKFWEVIDDTGTNEFDTLEAAEEYYNEGVAWAENPDTDYEDQLVLREVVELKRYPKED